MRLLAVPEAKIYNERQVHLNQRGHYIQQMVELGGILEVLRAMEGLLDKVYGRGLETTSRLVFFLSKIGYFLDRAHMCIGNEETDLILENDKFKRHKG